MLAPRSRREGARAPGISPGARVGLLGIAILFLGLLLAYLLYEIWPAVIRATNEPPQRATITLFDGLITFKPGTDSVLVLLVIVAGALGAYIHMATSFGRTSAGATTPRAGIGGTCSASRSGRRSRSCSTSRCAEAS